MTFSRSYMLLYFYFFHFSRVLQEFKLVTVFKGIVNVNLIDPQSFWVSFHVTSAFHVLETMEKLLEINTSRKNKVILNIID